MDESNTAHLDDFDPVADRFDSGDDVDRLFDRLLDVDKPKFTPLTNLPAQVANNAAPADVETVIVDGDVLMRDGEVKTIDTDAVRDRVQTAVDRFEAETDWELTLGGSEPLGTMSVARDLPKRGPVQLLARLAFQSARDGFPF